MEPKKEEPKKDEPNKEEEGKKEEASKEGEPKKEEPKKEEEAKKEGEKKEEGKQEQGQLVGTVAMPLPDPVMEMVKAYKAYNPHMNTYYQVHSIEENPNACVIC